MQHGERRVLIPSVAAVQKPDGSAVLTWSGRTMGTGWSARAIAPPGLDGAAAEAGMIAALNQVIAEMSSWTPASALAQFNELPAGGVIEAPEALGAVLACACRIAEETDGAFDPSIGALVDLWGFGACPPKTEAPNDIEIAQALSGAGWRKLTSSTASLRQPGGLRLDLSGIAKGFAVDQLARVLQQSGLRSFLVEIGGELRGAGVKPDGQPWWVNIEEPPGCPRAPIVAALHDLAIATSGDYQRYAVVEDRRIAHTIDPRTGRPLENGLSAVTVLHDDCMEADAYATALMVLGLERGLAFASSRALAARFVESAARGFAEHMSASFAAML